MRYLDTVIERWKTVVFRLLHTSKSAVVAVEEREVYPLVAVHL